MAAVDGADGALRWRIPVESWLDSCRNLRGREPKRPSYTKIPGFNVNHVPPRLRAAIFALFFNRAAVEQGLPNIRRSSGIPRLLGALRDRGFGPAPLAGFEPPKWPEGKRAALIFTLDVDSGYIVSGGDNPILPMMEKHGFHGAWFFLTGSYPIDREFVRGLAARGHEIGWHGHNHDHKMAFIGDTQCGARIAHAWSFFEEFGVSGMRTDNFLWSPALFRQLDGVLQYDTSMVDAYPFTENGTGCATGIPFRMDTGIWQVPTTITPDCFLPDSWSDDDWFKLQTAQIDWQIRSGGVVHVLAHPELAITLTPRRLALFGRILEYIAGRSSELWHALPRQLRNFVAKAGGET